jgi:hypothetical protein
MAIVGWGAVASLVSFGPNPLLAGGSGAVVGTTHHQNLLGHKMVVAPPPPKLMCESSLIAPPDLRWWMDLSRCGSWANRGYHVALRPGRHDTVHIICWVSWKGGKVLQNGATWGCCLGDAYKGSHTSAFPSECLASSEVLQRDHQPNVIVSSSLPP